MKTKRSFSEPPNHLECEFFITKYIYSNNIFLYKYSAHSPPLSLSLSFSLMQILPACVTPFFQFLKKSVLYLKKKKRTYGSQMNLKCDYKILISKEGVSDKYAFFSYSILFHKTQKSVTLLLLYCY